MSRQPSLLPCFHEKQDFETIILPLSFANLSVHHLPRVIQY